MSGTRHHYLPQFLQRGFSSKFKKNECYSWYFRKSFEPVEANIKNIGCIKHFYGETKYSSLDNRITEIENDFSKMLQRVLSLPNRSEINEALLSHLFAHMSTRTLNCRESFNDGAKDFLMRFKEKFSTVDSLIHMFHQHIKDNRIEFDKELIRSWKSQGYQGNFNLMLREFHEKTKDDEFILNIGMQVFPQLSQNIDDFISKSSDSMNEIHNNVLSKIFIPPSRVEYFEQFIYYLLHTPSNSIVLGDAGPFSITDNEKRFCNLFDLKSPIKAILFPISHDRVILGTKTNSFYDIDIRDINYGSSSCSREFFISSQRTQSETDLTEILGANSHLLSPAEINSVVNEIFP